MLPAQRLILLSNQYLTLRRRADAAAIRNGAMLLYGGMGADAAGNLFQENTPTTSAMDGSVVGYMRDVSGSGYHGTQTTNKPTVEVVNGVYAVRFNGASNRLSTTFPQPTSDFTFIAAITPDASATGVIFNGGAFSVQFQKTTDTNLAQAKPNVGAQLNATTPAGGVPVVVSSRKQGTARSLYVNGTLGGSDTSAVDFTGTGAYSIGANTAGASWLAMRGFLFCMCNAAMSDADRIAIERFGAFLARASYG